MPTQTLSDSAKLISTSTLFLHVSLVIRYGAYSQMIRIDAQSHVAFVHNYFTFGYKAVFLLPCKTVDI